MCGLGSDMGKIGGESGQKSYVSNLAFFLEAGI
ncbi:hypothetical protein SAMN05421543_106240 [Alicyclobacillus macrosporangiidus]|uniref:Uncharacterized protein n=1 Tax=Alicyclobacillus macrosporangiidus TaxID=392015 RepID=A0A1I7IIG8_9BACL|nr:hypothetical protein SAMN05421543_106240 [Alicyclobacillus macrosporangiidus]